MPRCGVGFACAALLGPAEPVTKHEAEPNRGRAPFRWLTSRAAVPILIVGPQLVPIAAIGYATDTWTLGLVPAAALTAAFFRGLRGPRVEPRSRAHLYLGLWPFFAWWATCVVLSAIVPVAAIVGIVAGAPRLALVIALGMGLAAGVAAIVRTPRVTRVELTFADLPPAFDGYRIAQLSDVHCGAFAPEPRVRDWVRRVNALDADLIAITGDLIASGTDYVPSVASALAELQAPDGVVACMGNHDYFGTGEMLADALRAQGLRLLRNERTSVRRRGQKIDVAGIDDTWTRRDDIDRALDGRDDQGFLVLLAHDPDLFPAAAARGVQLTLSGHTHGGQLAVPFAAKRLNLARLAHAYTSGLYRERRSMLFVNRGAGTSGPPVRIGTRAEIALLTLHRATS
jgi:uncharacterized protein